MQTQVVIVDVPRLLCDILMSLANQEEDLEIVIYPNDKSSLCDNVKLSLELEATVAQTKADVLVLGHETAKLSGGFEQLLMSHPQLRILALQAEGRNVQVYSLRPEKLQINEVSPAVLLDIVKGLIYCA